MVRGMLCSGLQGLRGCPLLELRDQMKDLSDWGTEALSFEDAAQASFEKRLDALEKDLADRQERDSFSMEVANLFGELEVVKAEMEELQVGVASLSARRDTSWEALHQRLR
ncbi:hypothetical protein AMTR_s00006p00234700 [Amborella trichopoda]|uniref:Uncharacterized protein n=1 Tax=Amborella trichopoda TaxID=13333 RepID=W1P763_AMBTC|nr:hypothetical protein AMTR_s00006p00234700 [Amborella trichopoda]